MPKKIRITSASVLSDGSVVKQPSVDPFSYPADPFDVSAFPDGRPPAPDYRRLLSWMHSVGGRSASLDFWARGNYARRLIHNKVNGVRPLLVPVQFIDEVRWAYRRLALLGVPMEFLWQGSVSRPVRVVHLHPAEPESTWDAGWGYVAATGGEVRMRGTRWGTVCGYARLLPEVVGDWLAEEAQEAFANGRVFITPEELVGVSSDESVRAAFEGFLGSLPIRSSQQEELLLSLDLPALEGLAPAEFDRLLADSEVELERLRVAFRRLVDGAPQADLETLVAEINYEVSELTLADRYHRFRAGVTKLGGVVGVSAAAIGSAVAAISPTKPSPTRRRVL